MAGQSVDPVLVGDRDEKVHGVAQRPFGLLQDSLTGAVAGECQHIQPGVEGFGGLGVRFDDHHLLAIA